MKQYHDFLNHILTHGKEKSDRTGVGTISTFGYQMRFDLKKGFPLLTTKKIHTKSIIYELLWFLKGDTNIKYLNENGVTIWDEWADENGDLGNIYGKQWRNWNSKNGNIDQIQNAINLIKSDKDSRRNLVSAWNVAELSEMRLNPCHTLFQLYVDDNGLSCQLYQRSADAFLGVPFNIASYALLTHMIAQVTDLEVYEFIHTFGDAHIYKNHLEQVETLLKREPYDLPTLYLNENIKNINDFTYNDIKILNYNYHPAIKALVAV